MGGQEANGIGIFGSGRELDFKSLLTPFMFPDIPQACDQVIQLAKVSLPSSRTDLIIDASMRSGLNDTLAHNLIVELLERSAAKLPKPYLHDLLIKWVRDVVEHSPKKPCGLAGIQLIFERAHENINPTVTTFVLKSLGNIEGHHVEETIEKVLNSGVIETLDEELISSILETWKQNNNSQSKTCAQILAKACEDRPDLDRIFAQTSSSLDAL